MGTPVASPKGVLGEKCKQADFDGTLQRGQHLLGPFTYPNGVAAVLSTVKYEVTRNCDILIKVGGRLVFHQVATHDQGQGCKLAFGTDGELMTVDSAGPHWKGKVADRLCPNRQATSVKFETAQVKVLDQNGKPFMWSNKGRDG